jgi:hypothetical protein
MATAAEIKTSIDTNITNKTLPGTIDNTLVGADVKSIVDYVDQEITALDGTLAIVATTGAYSDLTGTPTIPTPLVKVLKTTISSAEILQLFTTPKVILLNNDLATIKIPTSVYVYKNDGTNYTLGSNGFYILNSTNNVEATIYLQTLTTAGTGYSQTNIAGGNHSNMTGITRMDSYSIQATVSNPIGGTGTLDVYVVYTEITL